MTTRNENHVWFAAMQQQISRSGTCWGHTHRSAVAQGFAPFQRVGVSVPVSSARSEVVSARARGATRTYAMLDKLFGKGSSGKATIAAPPKMAYFNDSAPSWEELTELVKAKQAALGVDFWADPNTGPTNAQALTRLFGSTQPPRIKLYRDHAAWCPYCHKVWFQLEEKRIPYTLEKINMRAYGDKPASFLQKVPSGLLPVMEIDGRVVTESSVIMALLEEQFPEHKALMPPAGTPERVRADTLMRLERRFFSDWLNWLCSEWGHEQAKARFESCLEAVESELKKAGGPFFLGSELSLVDITFTPMVERAAASLAYYKGYHVRGTGRWPAIEAWFNALEQRPTYLATRSDYYTHAHDLPPQLGGCGMHADGVPVAAALDGGAWRLPLPPLSATSLPEPYSPGDNPQRDTVEAAARLVKNHVAVVRFALRGPGKPGPRPVSAPLADPTAIPAEEWTAAGDAMLRHVVHALLVGPEAKQVSQQALQVTSTAPPAGSPAAGLVVGPVVAAAHYLRDRVGVPRDMSFPAARQLRAHLTWVMEELTA